MSLTITAQNRRSFHSQGGASGPEKRLEAAIPGFVNN